MAWHGSLTVLPAAGVRCGEDDVLASVPGHQAGVAPGWGDVVMILAIVNWGLRLWM